MILPTCILKTSSKDQDVLSWKLYEKQYFEDFFSWKTKRVVNFNLKDDLLIQHLHLFSNLKMWTSGTLFHLLLNFLISNL